MCVCMYVCVCMRVYVCVCVCVCVLVDRDRTHIKTKCSALALLALKVTCFHKCVKCEGKKNFRVNKSSYLNVNADVFVWSNFILKECCCMNRVLRLIMILNSRV